MTNKLYVVRDASGNDWHTARMHDAISVDASYHTPWVDTKTWWERDPLENIQSWGHENQQTVSLELRRIDFRIISQHRLRKVCRVSVKHENFKKRILIN
jgi:hypothetical protein